MKKIIFTILLLTLTSTLFADVIAKKGRDTIWVERSEIAVGYRYCVAGKECSQIGKKAFYSIDTLKKRRKIENTQAIATKIFIPVGTVVGLALGLIVSHDYPFFLVTALGGLTGSYLLDKDQQKDVDVLMIEENTNMIVKNDKAMLQMRKRLEKILAKIK